MKKYSNEAHESTQDVHTGPLRAPQKRNSGTTKNTPSSRATNQQNQQWKKHPKIIDERKFKANGLDASHF